jgi:predicted aspartyl protease
MISRHALLRLHAIAALGLTMPFHAATAAGACRYIEQASLELSHSDQSQTPTVAGQINREPVRMLLDTGAGWTYIMRAEADRQNLHPERIRQQTQGIGGLTSVFLVKVKAFGIGDARAVNLRFPVLEAMDKSGIAALVGADFLMQYDVEMDLAQNRVKLFRADYCGDRALAYWDQHAMSVPMTFTERGSSPLVQVKINGVTLSALIDSGASRTLVNLSTARKLGFALDAPGVTPSGKAQGIGSAIKDVWNMTFDSFAIGDEVIRQPRIGVFDDTDLLRGRTPFQMILGRDFLRAHHVLLAQSQMQLYYSYNGGTVFPAHAPAAAITRQAAP